MSGRSDRKKRKINDQGGTVGVDGGNEEATLTKTMNVIINQNRDMLEMMKSMQEEMEFMKSGMKNLQGEMKTLQGRAGWMDNSVRDVKKKQNTNHMMLLDMDKRQKYHEVLLKNQKWEYSAPRPSQEYWNGLDPVEDGEAENFLESIEKYTKDMRHGTEELIGGNQTMAPPFPVSCDIDLQARIPFNEELLPHWKEFASALEQFRCGIKFLPEHKDTILSFRDMELSDEVVDLLSKALTSTHFKRIILRNNNLSKKGVAFALNHLKDNDKCIEFLLRGNALSMNNIQHLCEIVSLHSSVKILALCDCVGEDINGYEILKSVMLAGRTRLDLINLSDNRISTGGDTFISDFLAKNHKLESLHLTDNRLDDNDAMMIASALKHNTKLRTLILKNNNLTNAGWKALHKAVYDETSLNAAADTNHTCNIDFPPFCDYDNVRENGLTADGKQFICPRWVKHKKIYSVLSLRNRETSNVKHFENVPVEILPDMLESIEYYSNYSSGSGIIQHIRHVHPLSLVYEICRHWDEALAMFESLISSENFYDAEDKIVIDYSEQGWL